MDLRVEYGRTAAARLAAVFRSLVIRTWRCAACNVAIPPYTPDYADIRAEIEPWTRIEALKERLAEAKLVKNNEARIAVLQGELAAAYFLASKAVEAANAKATGKR